MYRVFFLMFLVLCLATAAAAEPKELVLPAGAILQCTLSEPISPGRTMQVGDPVACAVGPFSIFGSPAFPRGAYLSGHFAAYREPGRFFGKGWLHLVFDRLVLPGDTLPLAVKVISVPHFKVDGEGKIQGRGRARRDARGWAIPFLWPLKLLTLPFRGPRPVLQAETRVKLRLLEEVRIPTTSFALSSGAMGSPSEPSRVPTSTTDRLSPAGSSRDSMRRVAAAGSPVAVLQSSGELEQVDFPNSSSRRDSSPAADDQFAVLVLKDGSRYLATDYWVDAGQLHYVSYEGRPETLPLAKLDLHRTRQLNRERGVSFVLRFEQ